MIIIIAMFFCIMMFALVVHFLMAIPLYKMAQTAGHETPWLAWIPYAQTYLLFTLPGGRFKLFNNDTFIIENRSTAFWIYIICTYFGTTISSVVTSIPFVGWVAGPLIGLAVTACIWLAAYQAYKDIYTVYSASTSNGTNIIFAVLSIIVPFTPIIFLFMCMNHNPVYVEDDHAAPSKF